MILLFDRKRKVLETNEIEAIINTCDSYIEKFIFSNNTYWNVITHTNQHVRIK